MLGVSVLGFDAAVLKLSSVFFFDYLHLSGSAVTAIVTTGVVAITLGLYVYNVYLVDLGAKKSKND